MVQRECHISLGWLYYLFFMPLDSTRYFEFDFVWRALAHASVRYFLDVSSPRLFPILFCTENRATNADLINPDASDLAITTNWIRAAGLGSRIRTHASVIESSLFADETFDAITSISVVEHIPDETPAICKIWKLLKPGGMLFLTLPCAAIGEEQYVDYNPYALLQPDADGYFFLQHLYDETRLRVKIFEITGLPVRSKIYGEKRPGFLSRNLENKSSPRYPFWREPAMMGREFAFFDRIAELPGQGVIAMEFVKG